MSRFGLVMAVAWLLAALVPGAVRAQDLRAPAQIVDAFHTALADGDRAGVLSLMTRNVVVFEDGLMDRSREAYAGDHLPRDMAFARNVTRRLENRREGGGEAERWVTSSYRKIGTFRREPVKQTTRETVLLRRERAGWRIAHIHWSSVSDDGPH